MREAGFLTARALHEAGKAVEPGVTTLEIDRICRKVIEDGGGSPSFLGYNGFPASACISVNNEVIHGIPDKRALKSGDIVSIDVGAKVAGYHGDSARTFACGDITPEAARLIETTEQSFWKGLELAVAGNRVGDISSAVQRHAEDHGYSVIREFTGHGIGMDLHEEPSVPNYGPPGRGERLFAGMTIAIEPMIIAGKKNIRTLENNWTIVTADGSLASHFEHTVAITADGPVILTALE